jgi:threonine dehydrogenase-like Zn-dependent dehydrogenase
MKAVAVFPGKAGSVHLEDLPEPRLDEVGGGRGVMVRVLSLGLDGTDREINEAKYGAAPPGSDFLVVGHESLGVVEEVGPNVDEFKKGDHVVCMVRRPGQSIYDRVGRPDFTTDDTYHEHGINLLHGFLTERYVDQPENLVEMPEGLADVGVLLEPTSVAEKGVNQAYEIQRRVRVWRPRRAAVLGGGPLGLLAALVLRLRGLDVTTFALQRAPYLNSDLVEALGARYLSTSDVSLSDGARDHGPFDVIFEATGFSPLAFEAMQVVARNGVVVLSSVTGGDRKVEVPTDAINLGFVLGNKVAVGTVNAGREDFETGVRDLAMAQAQFPGWLGRLITHVLAGLDDYKEAFELLESGKDTIKIAFAVAEDSPLRRMAVVRSRG